MGGRWIAGGGQLLLAITGFAFVTGWFVTTLIALYSLWSTDVEPQSSAWLGKWGALLFGAAWLWSLITSLSLLWEAKTADRAAQKNPPPHLSEFPDSTEK